VDWIAGLIIAALIIGLLYGLQWRRRRQAGQAAATVGGVVGNGPATASMAVGVGLANPAVPPPTTVPDQRSGVALSGPPVRLTVCGLPALAWQRSEMGPTSYQGIRLSLIVDAGVGLPVLQLFHHAGILSHFADSHGPSGVDALDQRFRISGDLAAWSPVLSRPDVQQALLGFPLESLSVLGARLTLVSGDGVHLEPNAMTAIAGLAAALIGAIPPQITSAAATPPPTAMTGGSTDVDAIVSNVFAKSNLSPEQQQAMLALIRANQGR
jgi:hypothetical protein